MQYVKTYREKYQNLFQSLKQEYGPYKEDALKYRAYIMN